MSAGGRIVSPGARIAGMAALGAATSAGNTRQPMGHAG